MKNRYDKICRCSLLIIFIGFMGSNLFFNHTHISDGNITVHSHPFKAGADGKPIHSHVDYSYILVHMLNNFIATPAAAIFFPALILIFSGKLLPLIPVFNFSSKWELINPQRGPPSLFS